MAWGDVCLCLMLCSEAVISGVMCVVRGTFILVRLVSSTILYVTWAD